ncbi:MAG TPA: ACP S-malonyltransferase [Bdellovibrionales bacterium]|nr:ACP S-malonyltransferase [Bdellovibrionales bacterium]
MWSALFPGQGSQHVGMGRFLFDNFSSAKHLFEEASDTLKLDFKKLCFDGPESDLTLTENTQPALLLVSVATYKVLTETTPLKFAFGAGHSLGEYSALVAAGTLNFGGALKAVRARGQAMQQAVPVGQGGMLAVLGLSDDEVIRVCQWAESESGLKPLEPANFNAPGQVVVSGSQALCTWLQTNFDPSRLFAEKKRAKLIPLNVSAPFHCSLMKPAQDKMEPVLNDLRFATPQFPVVQNVTAAEEKQPERLKKNLIAQISAPVKWVQSVTRMKALGVRTAVEVGPSKVLSGLVKKIDSELRTFNIQSLDELKALEQEANHAS